MLSFWLEYTMRCSRHDWYAFSASSRAVVSTISKLNVAAPLIIPAYMVRMVRGAFVSLDTNSLSLQQPGLPSTQQHVQQHGDYLNQTLSSCITNAVAEFLLPQSQVVQQQQQQMGLLQRQFSIQSPATAPLWHAQCHDSLAECQTISIAAVCKALFTQE